MARMLVWAITTAFVVIASQRVGVQAQTNGCNAILEHGIYDYIYRHSSRSIARDEHRQVCERSEQIRQRNDHAAAAAQYLEVGGSGEFTQQRYDSLMTAYCMSNRSQSSMSQEDVSAVRTLNQAAVQAWERCQQAYSPTPGRQLRVEQNDTTVTVWLSLFTGRLRVDDVHIEGMTCAGSMLPRRRPFTMGDSRGTDASVNLRCTRTAVAPQPTACGAEVYPLGRIQILTDSPDTSLDLQFAPRRRDCPAPSCRITAQQQQFGEGPAAWPGEQQCRGIPERMQTVGTGAGTHAAVIECTGFQPGEGVDVAGHLAIRSLFHDGSTRPFNCHCSTGHRFTLGASVSAAADDAHPNTFAPVGDPVTGSGASTESCNTGVNGAFSGRLVVPPSGRFTVRVTVTQCDYSEGTTCRFVDGTNISIAGRNVLP